MPGRTREVIRSDADVACPLCAKTREREVVDEDDLAAVIADAFLRSPGHTLIVPKRHGADWFDLIRDEQCGIVTLAGRVHVRWILPVRAAYWEL